MYNNGEVSPRGLSYAAERRRTYDLQAVRDDEELAGEVIAAQGRLTQRTLTSALSINLVAAEVQRVDPDHGMQYESLAAIGVARLGRILSGER
jgi:hypothetical protein